METTFITCPNCNRKLTVTLFVREDAEGPRRRNRRCPCGETVSYGISVGPDHVPLASDPGDRDDDKLEEEALQIERDPQAG